MNSLVIDVKKEFPSLPKAPIVEAVVHWQAPATVTLSKENLQARLDETFPSYNTRLQYHDEIGLRENTDGLEVRQRRKWQGVRLSSPDETQPEFVCQFLKDGIVFSRLAPYKGWANFLDEATQFWLMYIELAQPISISQLSVRYISQISVESLGNVGQYIEQVCSPLDRLELSANHFFHQDSIQLDNHPYRINVVRAVQPATEKTNNLIVDISVATTIVMEDLGSVGDRLNELRFIKNEVFFTLMNDAKTKFGES